MNILHGQSTANPIKFATLILNTEAWQQSDTFDEELGQGLGVEATTKLYDFYRIPLERVGFDGTLRLTGAVGEFA